MENIEKLIDLVENTAPKCTLGIDTEVYFKDDDGVGCCPYPMRDGMQA